MTRAKKLKKLLWLFLAGVVFFTCRLVDAQPAAQQKERRAGEPAMFRVGQGKQSDITIPIAFWGPHPQGFPGLSFPNKYSQYSLYLLSLTAPENPPFTAPATVEIHWQILSRSSVSVDGRIETTLDGQAISTGLPDAITVGAGSELSGTFSIYDLGPGDHQIEMKFWSFTGGTHFEPHGPTGVQAVPNSTLSAQDLLMVTINPPAPALISCNGDPRLCDRRYDEVSYATTHNAFVNEDEGWIDPSQEHGLRRQLDDGIRALMLDAHEKDGEAYLCHQWCGLGPGQSDPTLESGLVQVRQFLADNPHEVVTLFIENYVTPAQLEAAFARSGALSFVYTYGSGQVAEPGHPLVLHWPTLRQMIAANRRLVVLVNTDQAGTQFPWQHYEYLYDGQTGYTYHDSSGDICCDCEIDRGSSSGMFVMNHFLQDPYLAGWNDINAFDFLNARAVRCRQERGHIVNFVVVNHYSTSAVLSVVAGQNGLL